MQHADFSANWHSVALHINRVHVLWMHADLPDGLVLAPNLTPRWESTTKTTLSGTCTTSTTSPEVTCSLGSTVWAVGDTVAVTVPVRAEQAGTLINRATIRDDAGNSRDSEARIIVSPSVRSAVRTAVRPSLAPCWNMAVCAPLGAPAAERCRRSFRM